MKTLNADAVAQCERLSNARLEELGDLNPKANQHTHKPLNPKRDLDIFTYLRGASL